jgi:hydroxymethylpyrimidine/phosphomethylpyrimidine kinase
MDEIVEPPVVMTVAGFDPSGGAGVLADIKTIAAFGCYGVAAVTSVTFQNTTGVLGAHHQSAGSVRRQIEALFDDFEIAAIKTGMLPTREIVAEVAAIIRARSVPIVVVDPVLRSTSGFELIEEGTADSIRTELFPLASLVTPNVAEAQIFSGEDIRDLAGAQRVAQQILTMGPRAVLITGGDVVASSSTDVLEDDRGSRSYSVDRIKSNNTHGTGCAFASALACLLAKGIGLRDAISIAKRYIADAINEGPGVGYGRRPLNHFPNLLKGEFE